MNDPISSILSFVNAYQLETQTAPTMADVAARFVDLDCGYWLPHLVDMGYLISSRLVYIISSKGLTSLERATGVQKIVSGSMIIGYDPADGVEAWNQFRAEVISLRAGSNVNADFIGNDPRMMNVAPSYHKAVYFSEWFEAETAARFKAPLPAPTPLQLDPAKIEAAQESNRYAMGRMTESQTCAVRSAIWGGYID